MNNVTSDVDLHIDTQARNQRFRHYDIKVVMVPNEHVRMLSKKYREPKASILADRNLTDEGKANAIARAKTTKDGAINEFNEQRLKAIDADLLEKRAALLSDSTRPNPKHVELMASQLMKHTLHEIAVFYNSATEFERRAMKEASASLGRVPMKTTNGLEWKTLLEPEMVNEAIMARAEATNPAAAEQVRELSEIRAMQVTITGVALAEIEPVRSAGPSGQGQP